MKYFFTILTFLVIGSGTLLLSGCGEDAPSTPAEQTQLDKLVGTWQLQTAALTGSTTSWTDEFDGATLVLSGTYSAGGTYAYTFNVTPWPINSPWPEDGNWKFKGTSGTDLTSKIIRLDDSVEISYTLTNNQLTLTFPYSGDGFPDGRLGSVEGNWTFTFTK